MKVNGPHYRTIARAIAALAVITALGSVVLPFFPGGDRFGLSLGVAGALAACGVALLLWMKRPVSKLLRQIARGLGGLVMLIALGRMGYALISGPSEGSVRDYFYWISSLKGLHLAALGAGIASLKWTVRRGVRPADYLIFLALAFGFTMMLIALFCLSSALCAKDGGALLLEALIGFMLTWGLIFGAQSGGLLLVLTHRSSTAALLRRLLLLNALLLPVLGWLQFIRQSRDPYLWEFEIALLIAENLSVFAFSVFLLGAGLIKADLLRRKAEHRRAQRESDFVATFEQAAVGLAHVSISGRFLKTNERLSTLLGYSREEFRRLSFQELTHPDDLGHDLKYFHKVLSGESARYTTEKRYFRKDGSVIWANLTVALLRSSEGSPKYFISVIEDISERKQEQEALKAASETKDRFISIISHELRTPLTPVLAALSGEGDAAASLSDPAVVAMMRRNIEHETSIINDLLDLTRISACGKLKLELRPMDLHQLIHEVVRAQRASLQEQHIACHLQLEAQRCVVSGDPVRLRQIFMNLLDNAIKFTPEGGSITLTTKLIGKVGECDGIEVTLHDSGEGIPQEHADRIFDPFEQGNAKPRSAKGGLGLGLAIVRGLVNAHGGQIELKPSERGARFVFHLCLTDEPIAEALEAPVQSGGKLRILLVEDHEDTRYTLERLLKRRGHQVITAGSVSEAIAAAQQRELDLVISDIGLPGESGLEIPASIRVYRPAYAAPLPCIALSGFGSEEDVRRSLKAGFSQHLTKPVEMKALDRAIQAIAWL